MNRFVKLTYQLSRFEANTKKQFQVPLVIKFDKFDEYILVDTDSYSFLIKQHPKKSSLMIHLSSTPASLLFHNHLHLLSPDLPAINREEKYKAYQKLLKQKYQNAFKTCKTGPDIFHMQRRIKLQIRNKQDCIGILNDKYKHYPLWISYREYLGLKTEQEYQKRGVSVSLINNNIIPTGKVWMPTRQNYLELVDKYMNNSMFVSAAENMLDLGCGSGILSFILQKRLKKNSKIVGLDINKDAVQTSNINSARLNIKNFVAHQFDIHKYKQYRSFSTVNTLPKEFDLIVSNPPWLIAKKLSKQIGLDDGVYDQKQLFLKSTFQFAKMHMKKNGRLLLIYSNLSIEIGLTSKTVQEYCKDHNFIIRERIDIPYSSKLEEGDHLKQYKQKSKITLYQISKNV